jgi:hypothetical protein
MKVSAFVLGVGLVLMYFGSGCRAGYLQCSDGGR